MSYLTKFYLIESICTEIVVQSYVMFGVDNNIIMTVAAIVLFLVAQVLCGNCRPQTISSRPLRSLIGTAIMHKRQVQESGGCSYAYMLLVVIQTMDRELSTSIWIVTAIATTQVMLGDWLDYAAEMKMGGMVWAFGMPLASCLSTTRNLRAIMQIVQIGIYPVIRTTNAQICAVWLILKLVLETNCIKQLKRKQAQIINHNPADLHHI